MDVTALDLAGERDRGPLLGVLIGLPVSISLWALAGISLTWALRS